MEIKFKIHKLEACSVVLEDCTCYLGEEEKDLFIFDTYKASQCVSFDAVFQNKSSDTSLIEYAFNNKIDPVKIKFDFDGWGLITHVIVPTRAWIEKLLESENNLLGYYGGIYCSDGEHFFKYVNSHFKEVSPYEILEINPEGTTILKASKDFISLCSLKQCYIDVCKQILERGLKTCIDKSDNDQLIYKRDALWMAINVIGYLVEILNYAEAQRILENIESCNGLCKRNIRHEGGCGCSHLR